MSNGKTSVRQRTNEKRTSSKSNNHNDHQQQQQQLLQQPFHKETKNHHPQHKWTKTIGLPIGTSHFLGLLVLILVVCTLVIVIEKQLPPGLKVADERDHPNRFIGERAYRHLKSLTAIGSRIAGSRENEVLAVDWLKGEIEAIVRDAKPHHVIALDVQRVSGAFALTFLDGMTNAYRDLQNVVVKVGSKIDSSHSLLINCHFDTVVDSPGASDDGAGCAVMLEMLRVISQSDRILKHNIIFLFNGGEESFLPASHGFITQHKWAKEIRAFINLEACGAGGREVLFQAGPNHPWILETYSEEVPYPYASSLAQEIFQSGVIPGDTDYRIFRDFGNLSGLDFAWSSNGYVYHTKFDSIEQVPLGSLQRTGDNILALARGMAQGHQLSDVEKHRAGNLVFFDFLGAFVVRWPMIVSDLVNLSSVIISLYAIYSNANDNTNVISRKTYGRKLLKCMGVIVLTIVACVFVSVLIALLLNQLGRTMSWYARPIWLMFLYVIPTVVTSMGILIVHSKRVHKDIDVFPWTVYQLYYDAYQTFWTVLLFAGILLRIRSSFIPLLWTIFPAIGTFLRSKLFNSWRDARWLLLHIVVMGLPFVQCFYLMIGALYLFIPVMGRIGSGYNSEILIAVMVSLLFSFIICYVTPLILMVRRVESIFKLLIGIFLMSVAVLLLTRFGFPYSGEQNFLAPQKFMLAHAKRTYHDYSGAVADETSGYWIIDMDLNSPHSVDRYVKEMTSAVPVIEDCDRHLYCGLPYLVPVLSLIWKTSWIAGPKPHVTVPLRMTVVSRSRTATGEMISFTADGPSHMGVMFSPVVGVELRKWSLPSEPLVAKKLWNERKTYFIFYSYADKPVPFNLTLDLNIAKDHTGPVLDLAITTHFMFGPSKRSQAFEEFIAQFPPWTAINAWTATYESWIL